MKQLLGPEVPHVASQTPEPATISLPPATNEEPRRTVSPAENENKENEVGVTSQDLGPQQDKDKSKAEKKDDTKADKMLSPIDDNGARSVSKQDETPVNALLALGKTSSGDEKPEGHTFLVPSVPTNNGVVEKKSGKASPKQTLNKIAADLAEQKSQENRKADQEACQTASDIQQHILQKTKNIIQKGKLYQKQKQIRQQQLHLKQQQLQHRQQQLQQQKQQIQHIIHQQQLQHQMQQQQLQQFHQQQLQQLQNQQQLPQLLQGQQQASPQQPLHIAIQQQAISHQQNQSPVMHQILQMQSPVQTLMPSQQQPIIIQPRPQTGVHSHIQSQQQNQAQAQLSQVPLQQTKQVNIQSRQPLLLPKPQPLVHLLQQPMMQSQPPPQAQQIQRQKMQQNHQSPKTQQANASPQNATSNVQDQQAKVPSSSPRPETASPQTKVAEKPSTAATLNVPSPQPRSSPSPSTQTLSSPSPQPQSRPAPSSPPQLRTSPSPTTQTSSPPPPPQRPTSSPPPKPTSTPSRATPTPPPRGTTAPSRATPTPTSKRAATTATPPPRGAATPTPPQLAPPSRATPPPPPKPKSPPQPTSPKTTKPVPSPSPVQPVSQPTPPFDSTLSKEGTEETKTQTAQSTLTHFQAANRILMSGGNVNMPQPAQNTNSAVCRPLLSGGNILQQKDNSAKNVVDLNRFDVSALNGSPSTRNPQVTLNTSNGSLTIMAKPKTSTDAPAETNEKSTVESPRPQGIHQNLPRTVLPKSPIVNGKPYQQKAVAQKNISGQRLNNNNLSELKNGLIQQSNINNRLPTFQKTNARKSNPTPPAVVGTKTGPTLDQRTQQLYNSGQTNKPSSPSDGSKSESRLASWLDKRFKPTTPEVKSPLQKSEVSLVRYKRKLQELQKDCEITQENPRPEDPKRRREVMPDVSIELMRAADMKKLEGGGGAGQKKEKRPVPGLKSIQEVTVKRRKEDEAVLDLSATKPGEQQQVKQANLPWLVNRPAHFISRPT